ncbi:hypothetical protein [Pseudomonas sp. URIL14HWK12:I7]|uniref:hypothetical protein n=1 Tax=Pseudomonas sp. URIL14HWK12:I7 TaxID=1283285 RepID=UPI00048847F6|nr:hypothetical protein [Pseudomonas sp. URIL14HWK12:I7]
MSLTREVVAVINSTVNSADRNFVVGWNETRRSLIENWDYFRTIWRGADIARPQQEDYGAGLEDTFRCLCNRVLPVYLAQADHVLSREEIPNRILFQQVVPPRSPGPLRQRITITLDDNNVIEQVTGNYIVEYQINPSTALTDIGRYGVDPGSGIIRAKIWDSVTRQESIEVFEFDIAHLPNAHTKLIHPGDPDFNITVSTLIEHDMCNLQLMCGPCNGAKQGVSYHYFAGNPASALFYRNQFSGLG